VLFFYSPEKQTKAVINSGSHMHLAVMRQKLELLMGTSSIIMGLRGEFESLLSYLTDVC
jgi:hypothetical protein